MTETRIWGYAAENASGEVARGRIAAESMSAASKALRAKGLAPFDLYETRFETSALAALFQPPGRLSDKEWAVFSGRMSELLNAGVPATAALALIARQGVRHKIGKFAKRIEIRLRGGERMSAVLADDEAGASRLMTALITTGEALGELGGQFEKLKTDLEAQIALRREIIGNLIYPAALFVLIILTLIFLSFFVLPQFESIFATSGAEPPGETKFVLAAGGFIRQWWAAALLAMLGVAFAFRIAIARYSEAWDRIVLEAPVLGAIVRQTNSARYCRSLGALLDGGMPLAKAMPIAQEAAPSSNVRRRLARVQNDVRAGGALSVALKRHSAVTTDAVEFVELGESTGALGKMTLRAADFIEQRLAGVFKQVAALSGPIMTAIMGLMTAGVIAAVMSGVMSLNDAVY